MFNSGQNWYFCPVWHWNLTDDLEYQLDTSSILHPALWIISKPSVNSNWSPETLNSGQNRRFCWPRDLEIWQMTLKNRAPLLYSSSIVHHFKAIGDFLCRVTIEFDGWPWKTTGHLFYATPRFVHHFIDICDYKLESGNTQFEFGKNGRFFIRVTSKFDGWPSRTIGHLS